MYVITVQKQAVSNEQNPFVSFIQSYMINLVKWYLHVFSFVLEPYSLDLLSIQLTTANQFIYVWRMSN